jgi:hypothetical protein
VRERHVPALRVCLAAGLLVLATACGRHPADVTSAAPAGDPLAPGAATPTDSFYMQTYQGKDFIYESIDHLFGRFVTPGAGLVVYDSLWSSFLFDTLCRAVGSMPMALLTAREDSFAFWINAYNVLVIRHIRAYGLEPQDQKNFPLFNTQQVRVAGQTLTLDELEKGSAYIRKFDDPRSHFALNCAAQSCPPLLNKAYRGSLLYEQLDFQAKAFINDSGFNPLLDSPPGVSMLFSWYAADFSGKRRDLASAARISDQAGSALDFIESYLQDPVKTVNLKSGNLQYVDYSWEINKQ